MWGEPEAGGIPKRRQGGEYSALEGSKFNSHLQEDRQNSQPSKDDMVANEFEKCPHFITNWGLPAVDEVIH